jgi:signal transduction histidine kinase
VNLAKSQIITAVTQGHQVVIEYDPPDDPITIQIDPSQIEDAVLNLVLNAIEALDGKGHVRVRLFRANSDSIEEEEAIVEVSDDGPGIREEDLTQLFSPFFTTRLEGTGLGLPAVKRIARLHGGRVEVRSSVGQGSVFAIHLPVTRNS